MTTHSRPSLTVPRQKLQEGATLIEALISILIMSIGLLGIAGLQLNALSYQKNAWSTHRVAEVTNDLAERILANPTGAKNGGDNNRLPRNIEGNGNRIEHALGEGDDIAFMAEIGHHETKFIA